MPSPCRAQSLTGRRLAPVGALLLGLAGPGGLEAQEVLALVQDLVSATPDGGSGDGDSGKPAISADGKAVAFESTATNLVREDGDKLLDVFLSPSPGRLALVSAGTAAKGNGPSFSPSLNQDGTLVLFASEADNLVPLDRNRAADLFLKDMKAGGIVRVSLSSAGAEGNGPSNFGVLSADGNVAVFQSQAGNLGSPTVPAGTFRIHVRDLGRGSTVRLDPPAGAGGGAGGPGSDSVAPDVSRDGRFIAFQSALPFAPGDRNSFDDIYRHDLLTRQTVRASVGPKGLEPDGPSVNPRISADGRFVAFDSAAANLVPLDRNKVGDVLVRDLLTGAIERASVGPGGEESPLPSRLSDLSGNGRFVLFTTAAALVPEDRNRNLDVYVRDRFLGRTALISAVRLPGGPPMSPDGPSENGATSDDGLLYTFDSRAPRILPQDPNPNLDVFRAELEQQVAGPFPPANALLAFTGVAGAAGRLIQLDLAGRPTGRALDVAGSFGGAAVDEANALWVAAGVTVGRFQALTLERQETFFQVPGVTRGLAAGGGAVFAAAGNSILRLAPGAEPVSFPLSRLDPDVVALAVDPLRRLWVSVVHPDAGEVLVFTPDLRLSRSFRRDAEGAFRALAFDALGNLAGRAKSRLAKVAAGGGELWSVPLAAGEGVAADGEGNIYTLTDRSFLAFRPDGRLLFSLPHDLGVPRPGTQLAVAGDGSVWAFLEGSPAVLRVLPRNRPPELAAIPIPQALGRQATGDLTGFLAANVTARGGDQDEDGFTNGDETRHLTNPFDPGDPAPDKRLRPIADLRPTLAGGRQVRIDWTSGQEYAFIHVFRDGRQIAGSPFPFDAASGGIVDAGVPGGPHTYRVIGQGNRGAGAGGGLDESGEVPEPFSFSTESTVTLGDGSLRALAPVSPPPDAVAFDSVAGRVLVVHAGGVLSTLDANLQFIEDTVLPADPFASNEVRGLAIDFADAARPLFLLLGDGRIFRKAGAADPVLAVTLNGITPSAAGFSGLVLVNGLFATMIGPDFDCFIGFQRTDGAVDSGTDSSLTTTLGTTVDISIGAARLGAAIIAGTGASPDSTITDIVKLNVAGTLVLTDAHANLPLSAVGSTDIAGFDFAPGLGLVVADRSGSRIAILEATFPGSPQVLTVTPPAGSFSRNTPGVVIAGTGFGTDAGDLWVGFDGVEVPIQGFNAGTQTITITAPALGETRDVEVEVFSSAGSGALASGFIYGFQRGDANDDGAVDISDALRLLTHLFGPADAPPCRDAGDADDSESLEVTDAVRILDFLFRGGPEPLAPFTGFGLDPGGETLGCGEP